MKLDLSVKVDAKMLESVLENSGNVRVDISKAGHVGTHFDVMHGSFPIEKSVTRGRIFDISWIKGREVFPEDIDLNSILEEDFVLFHSGILKRYGYGSEKYFSEYTELSDRLVDSLIERKISFIGVDMAGVKGPGNHLRIDQHCANHEVFNIENLDNLDLLLKNSPGKDFTVYTFPVNFDGFSGLPCRVIAEI